uniref:GPN-loop GTPase 3 n=1 Tax=Chromera velia CCMP2878 TaxID=1169474 RepID=A0A0G4FQV1_9ALVE|mmetsp:Transcript_25140/g.49150  ORF Transcript_25140/g.49150 Transcript_25140/m.49150 type:complete len:296 (+) Transcript_25140:226-1113(+)|eukprot:Cvel_18283.t1-p1 / transcript=Cvel_18283.t1 / gene=Cvel_18283 / organism=Chromera_velia_CCMP2878 / gene_product=GPN-loop GTPase 3 homolog, putative / transcript_product=GPN-loop GTPase 3 homolog, putative / location=Cvel_scaffold1506:33271-39210(+) / protein_length=295 / sequence_SO=supercontig / SO=protein_coding / is_pseudo=false
MTRFGQLVIGPAGSGKTTYCTVIKRHCEATGRIVRYVNLDPAAEEFLCDCDIDIRELISLSDVMEEATIGPNGGLVYVMEYIADNISWLTEQLDEFGDDEYFLFDCPGQIELYSHLEAMSTIVKALQDIDLRLAGVCCMDVTFVSEASKFLAGSMMALSAMVKLELPHINVLTKCDLLRNKDEIEARLDSEPEDLIEEVSEKFPKRFRGLTAAIADVLQQFSLVCWATLDPRDEEEIAYVLQQADFVIQYGESVEPKEVGDGALTARGEMEMEDDDDDGEAIVGADAVAAALGLN